MFRMSLIVFALVATPVLAQEQSEEAAATYVLAPVLFSTPLVEGVYCHTGDAVARIEAAAVYARGDNPDADVQTLPILVSAAVEAKISQLLESNDCIDVRAHLTS